MATDAPLAKKAKLNDDGKADDKSVSDNRPFCPYGSSCFRKNPKHHVEFRHSPPDQKASGALSVSSSLSLSCQQSLPPCKYGANCYRKNLLHFAEYSHPTKILPTSLSAACPGPQSVAAASSSEKTDEDTDTDYDEDSDGRASPSDQKLKRTYSEMTESERKELIERAVKAKEDLEKKLKKATAEISVKEKELGSLRTQLHEGHLLLDGEKDALDGKDMVTFTLYAERSYKEGSAAQMHYRLAESQFHRLLSAGSNFRVSKVDYIVSPDVVKRFRDAQRKISDTIGDQYSYPVLAFHGTAEKNIDPICRQGFKVPGQTGFKHATDTGWYGRGVYFSEYPAYSMSYIRGSSKLLLCQVLVGKPFKCTKLIHGQPLKKGFTSHTSPCSKELVIFDTGHILPCYIVHYTMSTGDFKYKESSSHTGKKKTNGAAIKSTDSSVAFPEASACAASHVFSGDIIVISGKFVQSQAKVLDLIRKHGGSAGTSVGMETTLVVASPDQFIGGSQKVTRAQSLVKPIVSELYLYDSIIAGKKMDVVDYAPDD